MSRPELVLTIFSPGSPPVTTRLNRALTTIGSAPNADVRLPDARAHWAVVQKLDNQVTLRVLQTGATFRLSPGSPVEVDGTSVALSHPAELGLPVRRLAESLSEAVDPQQALTGMLQGILEAASADKGAIILREGEGYTVAAAQDLEGNALEGPEELLSDHIVRDVLGTGMPVSVSESDGTNPYAQVPSVVRQNLKSVICVPMLLYEKTIGAVFLGHSDPGQGFHPRQCADLELLAAMAVPLLVQLRRMNQMGVEATAEIVGEHPDMEAVRRLIERVAATDLSILIQGETGTGKELVARAVHKASPRAGLPLVAVNCSSIPETLLAAELFGYRRGAFTGAVTDRKGLIEQADGSTLFLDEVGDMPESMQAALLRVLENREVTRLGEQKPRKVDFRLITATHKDLSAKDGASGFREDLLYRMNEMTISVPPLRERGRDILLLARLFLRQAERQFGLPDRHLSAEASEALMRYKWPGNVRELRATIRRSAVVADSAEILPADLGLRLKAEAEKACLSERTGGTEEEMHGPNHLSLGDLDRPLSEAQKEFTARYVAAVISRQGNDRKAAADKLEISLRSLYRYLGGS